MIKLLLISDDLARTMRLARDLEAFWSCSVHDLYDEVSPIGTPEIIVSDVRMLTSNVILRLRQLLERLRGTDVPYLCLLHDASARTRAQIELLAPSSTTSFSNTAYLLINTLNGLQEQIDPTRLKAQRHADTARRFLHDVFVPGQTLSPDIINVGTRIVDSAVRDTGILAWVRAVQRFDDATHQHCLLVAGLGAAFASSLGLGANDRHLLTRAALMHDVGKINIPTAILNKPGKLNAAEMAVMRTHPAQGHAMLVGLGFEDMLLTVVRSHHEILDGSGYPDKLKGWEIPDFVRLVTICDVYGALIERRPYRAPMINRQAYATLEVMRGQLDTDFVRAFHPIAEAFSLPAPPATVC